MNKRAAPPLDWRFVLRSLLLFLAYWGLFIFFNTAGDLATPEILLAVTVVVSIVALAWILIGQRNKFPLTLPVIIYLAAYVLTSLTSEDPRRSLGEMGFILLGFFLLAFWAELAAHGWPVLQMVYLWMVSGGVIALMMWLQVVDWAQRWQMVSAGSPFPALIFRLPSQNNMAYFLSPFVLMSAVFFLTGRNWLSRILWGGIGLFFGGLSYLASSRAAWLGVAIGLAFLLLWFLRVRKPDWHAMWSWLRARKLLLVLLVVIVAAALGGGAWILYQQTAHPTHAPVADARTEYWLPAWKAFLSSPVVGHGPYMYGALWLREYSVPPVNLYPHAHSMLFNTLAEGGIVLTLALLWLAWSSGRYVWKRLWRVDKGLRAVMAGSFAAMLALAVQGLFDCYYPNTLGLYGAMLLLGIVMGIPDGSQESREPIKRRPYEVLVVVFFLWLNLWLLDPLARGQQFADTGRWDEAAPVLQEAAERDPWLSVAWNNAGIAQAYLGNLEQAAANLEKAAELDPDWSLNWANLGAVHLQQGNAVKARLAFEQATLQEPRVAEFWLGLGQTAEAQGDDSAAQDAYRRALDLRPDWSKAYFWRSSELRQTAQEAWVSSSEEVATPTVKQLEAAIIENPSVADRYLLLGAEYLRLGRLDNARLVLAIADMAYYSNQRNVVEGIWLDAELAAAQGEINLAVARGEEALANLMAPGLFGPGASGGRVYFPSNYRRPSMFADFVPQFALILMTDTWGERMVQLSQWHTALGNSERAQEILDLVAEEIPDYPFP